MKAARRSSLLAVLTLVSLAAGVVGLVAWRSLGDPSVPFLSVRPPAAWIVHAMPWQLTARQVKERRVRFRMQFDLPSEPGSGYIRLRAFRGYTLWVNDAKIGGVRDLAASWKHVQEHDVAGALRSGRNEIQVEAVHNTGPPALWLVLEADETTVRTDAQWQARIDGGEWAPVRLATEPMAHPITRTSPTVADGWRDAWSLVALWTAVAAAVAAVVCWVRRRGRRRLDDDDTTTRPGRRTELALLGLVALLWLLLCANNLYRLPPVVGFDSPAHLEYVSFVQTHQRLPLASDGWEMYQPPLYYVLSACAIPLGRSAGWTDAEAAVPKLISMIGGLLQVILVWWVLRIMFPDSVRARSAGLVLAAAMPMNLYMSQYPSNELMSVALVTASVVLALRICRDDAATWGRYAILGGVLGLAMLAKHTAFLAVVVVLTVMAGRVAAGGVRRWRGVFGRVGVTAVTLLLVAGWFGYRNWAHFGNPLVGNWDPVSGNAWWQDPGVGTSAYYLRFGRSLTEPFHSCLYSYGDGIYSTLWGDGMCAGIADVRFRPPWHYDLMAVGYALAWLPTALIAVGLVAAVVRWIRRPDATWALLVGHGLLVGFAVFYMTLKLPYYAQAKGFYGLTAMACLCVLGGWGFDLVSRGVGRLGVVLWIVLVVWAVNAYASVFVWPVDAQTHCNLGHVFSYQGKSDRGVEHFRQAVCKDPDLIDAYAPLGGLLSNLGRYAEARQAWQDGLARDPNHLELMNNLAWLLATCSEAAVRDGPAALKLAQRACNATGHENPFVLDSLAAAQAENGQFDQAVKTVERAIELARSQGRHNALPGMRSRSAMYEAGRPYRGPTGNAARSETPNTGP